MARSDKKEPKAEEAPAYLVPPVELGDIVLWHASHEEPPVCSAVVTDVAGITVSLSLLHRNFYNMEPKDGVRHKDHPDKAMILSTESGCWSHRPGFLEAAASLALIESGFQRTPAEA